MDSKLLNMSTMDILTLPNNQMKLESETFFDKRSRENYFAMLEVAFENLSLFDLGNKINS